MNKYVLNSVVKISVMFAKYFEHNTIILKRPFFRGYAVYSAGWPSRWALAHVLVVEYSALMLMA